MEIDIFNMNDFVKLNKLEEVTHAVYLNPDRTPTENGIFSYDIFGIPGSRERKEKFSFVNLGIKVLHPYIYKQLTQMNKKFISVINGSKTFIINDKGELKEDEEGDTGIIWLYNNFEKIKFNKSDSMIRSNKVDLLKSLDKNEIFVDKWLIIPCVYRDINFAKIASGKISIDEINEFYIKIINMSDALKKAQAMDFVINNTIFKLQTTLVELYNFLMSKPTGKNGLIKKFMVGKNVDYSARAVISTSKNSSANSYNDMEIKTGELGIPLHMLCTCFFPFVVKNIRELLTDKLKGMTKILFGNESKEGAELFSETLSDKNIEKMISLFEKSPKDRWTPIYLQNKDGKKIELEIHKKALGRSFTITDLLFLAIYRVIKDKYVYLTRYPVDKYHNINPAKPVIITTENTVIMNFDVDPERVKEGKSTLLGVINNYPDINSISWRDSAILDNNMTGVLGVTITAPLTL